MNHDDDCLCFPCYGIRLRRTDSTFLTLQGFNNTIPNPMVKLLSFDEILLKKVEDRQFDNLWNSLSRPSLQ